MLYHQRTRVAEFYYGGQAVIEGVMMRGRRQATVVVRTRSGQLITRTDFLPASVRHPLARLPLVRGLVALWEMIILGMRMMIYSANVQAENDLGKEIPKRLLFGMIAVSLTFAIGLFFVLPLLLANAGGRLHGDLRTNVVEGAIRLALFLGYLGLLGRVKRMNRVFQYHGAEHKTVNAYEHGADLTPAAVQRFSTIHVRCGTAFLLWVVVISIFVFALLGHPPLLVGIVERLLLVPLIAAGSYEILRLGARFQHLAPVRIVMIPGLWLQRLTTREPSDDQIEVAIAALRPVLEADAITQTSPAAAASLQPQPSIV